MIVVDDCLFLLLLLLFLLLFSFLFFLFVEFFCGWHCMEGLLGGIAASNKDSHLPLILVLSTTVFVAAFGA